MLVKLKHPGTPLDYLPQQVREVLLSIEKIEDSWAVNGVGFDHSYGRVPGEMTIKLWSVPRSTGEFLYGVVSLTKPRSILEIGASGGYSTIWLAAAAARWDGIVYTYEIFPEKIHLLKNHIFASELSNIVVMEDDARNGLRGWDEPIDLIFLDADKASYLQYWELMQRFTHSGSIVIADNAVDYGYLMKDFLDAVKLNSLWESVTLPYDNGLLLAVRK
jgi:predicted O-methyltransferase YrrM